MMDRNQSLAGPCIKAIFRTLVVGFVIAGALSITRPASGKQSTQQADTGEPTLAYKEKVTAAGQAWLDGLGPEGLHIVVNGLDASYQTDANKPLPAYIRASGKPWHITLGFAEPISSSMDAAEVQQHLQFFAHDGFPTPGLRKRHWRIRAQTPSSSFLDGITVLEVGPGLLKLEVKARFFALYGRDVRAVLAADEPSPENSYFQIRQSFPGTAIMTFTVENF